MKYAKLAFNVLAVIGILSLAWKPSLDYGEQWLVTLILTCTAILTALRARDEFVGP